MKKKKSKKLIAIVCISFMVAIIVTVVIIILKGYRVIQVESFFGDVTCERNNKEQAVFEDMNLQSGDVVTTGDDSNIELLADSDKHIAAESNTCFSIVSTGNERAGKLTIVMEYGTALYSIDNKLNDDSEFEVQTPNASLSVRGTVFKVNYDGEKETARLDVMEGTVRAENESGVKVSVNAGESVIITEDNIVPVISIADAKIGDIVVFGSYEQDNDQSNGAEPIEWYVLAKEDGEAELMAVYILAWAPYNEENVDITWETCSLRKWMNEIFYNEAFSEEEQQMIVERSLENTSPGVFGAYGGNDTLDKVYGLMRDDIEDQDILSEGWRADATPYAAAAGVYEEMDGYCWWLRSRGMFSTDAESYRNHEDAVFVTNIVKIAGVRPVITVTY